MSCLSADSLRFHFDSYISLPGEVVGNKAVKRGTTNTNSIIVSASAFGDHLYGVFPCSAKNGRGAISNNCAVASIYTYNQTWRKAPSIKVGQDTDEDDGFYVTWTLDNNASGYYLRIMDMYTGSVTTRLYDRYGDIIDTKSETISFSKAADPEFAAGEQDGIVIAAEKVDKATVYKVTWHYTLGYEPPSGSQLKIQMCALGTTNDNSDLDFGKFCTLKTVRMVPQWNKTPKIKYCQQTSLYQSKVVLEWSYTGRPDRFYIYDGKNIIGYVDALSSGSYQSVTINTYPGSHSYKIMPYKNGFYGKVSGAKSIRVK